ncbi:hypothetical protein BURC_04687 [Burkholderiaceae bacterium]|nr:hypothetical protein BURC_04687 [Burkholderiaceae bacterium]
MKLKHLLFLAAWWLAGVHAAIAAPTFWLSDLGTAGTASAALAINESGQATGWVQTADGEQPFVFAHGSVHLLKTPGTRGVGTGLNDAGQVVGFYAGGPHGEATRAFVYGHGTMVDLGTLGGSSSAASAINNLGITVGTAYVRGDADYHAFAHAGGRMVDLGTLGGRKSVATGLNNLGQIVGYATVRGETRAAGFIYSGRRMIDLGTLGGNYVDPRGINEAGVITGGSTLAGETEQHAFIWAHGVMTDIGTLGGNFAHGYAINNFGQIVGRSNTARLEDRAFYYENGRMFDLNTLLERGAAAGWTLLEAFDINDAGQIVGVGIHRGQPRAFLLTPLPPRSPLPR